MANRLVVGTAMLREAVRPNVVPNLDILPAGALPPNPSELLGSAAMHRLLDELRAGYDVVIFDSPPALAVTDATVLGASSDAVILVDSETHRYMDVNQAAQRLYGYSREEFLQMKPEDVVISTKETLDVMNRPTTNFPAL